MSTGAIIVLSVLLTPIYLSILNILLGIGNYLNELAAKIKRG